MMSLPQHNGTYLLSEICTSFKLSDQEAAGLILKRLSGGSKEVNKYRYPQT